MAGLRVISGAAKGRRLQMVPGSETRPIGDRVKGALFNILGADIEGSRFLDLFAGTGSVGIEALSRGADGVVFVDTSPRAIRTIQENLRLTALEANARVVRSDSFAFLRSGNARAFDYVYVAPPQYQGLWGATMSALDRSTGCLNPDAWIIAQIHPREYQALPLHQLAEFDQRRYGSTLLVFWEAPGL